MRSAMNRIKLCSGGFAASLMVLVAASAVAQGAGEWTMAGRTYDLQRYSPLTPISRAKVKNLKAAWALSTGVPEHRVRARSDEAGRADDLAASARPAARGQGDRLLRPREPRPGLPCGHQPVVHRAAAG